MRSPKSAATRKPPRHWQQLLLAACLPVFLSTSPAWSQTEPDGNVPPPPEHFSRDALIPISLPGPGELRFGVDPQTLSVGPDEVVHYVLVASTSLAMNVSYEGVDCKNARTRVDARWNEHTGWKLLPDSPWRNLGEDRATRHATALAKGGMCDGRTPNAPVARIAHELRLGRSDINSH